MTKPCPCCGYLTVDDEDEIIVDICPICYWQYDVAAHNRPNIVIGANQTSLNQAKINFKEFGASDERYVGKTRQPLEEEIPQ